MGVVGHRGSSPSTRAVVRVGRLPIVPRIVFGVLSYLIAWFVVPSAPIMNAALKLFSTSRREPSTFH